MPQRTDLAIDLRDSTTDLAAVQVALSAVASELKALWVDALEREDFHDVYRLVEASHAVHRAVLALEPDSAIPGF